MPQSPPCQDQQTCIIEDLGVIEYEEAYARQKTCVAETLATGTPRLLLCEHYPVLTLGRLASHGNILASLQELETRGIKVLSVDRGGEVTLHGLGQLVVYPILDLRHFGMDLRAYLRDLEQVAIDFLKEFDILTLRIPGRTGVWVGTEKIVSVGIGVRKWIAFHGLAININTDLSLFSLIKPCGLDVTMTSVEQQRGCPLDLGLAKKKFATAFCRYFHLIPR